MSAAEPTFAIDEATRDDAYQIGRADGHDAAMQELHAGSDWIYLEAHERALIATALRDHAADRIRYQQASAEAWRENDRYQALARRLDGGAAS